MKKGVYSKKTLTFWQNFYQKLYKHQNTCSDIQKQLFQQIKPKFYDTQNQKLTKQIQIIEIPQALQTMENGKSPGIDGIPVEFYKEFFNLLTKKRFTRYFQPTKNNTKNLEPRNNFFNTKTNRKIKFPKIWETHLFTMHGL